MATDPTKDKTQQAIADAKAREQVRIQANQEDEAALQSTHRAELKGLQDYNTAQYENVGQIVGDIQSKIDTATAKDALARKRENAYRYISGLGDTLSSLANLVGVANKASNQQQTYNSHAVVQKAEEARKTRKLEMDDLSKRLDEMTIRQRELKASGSLAEAQLRAKQAREALELNSKQRQNEETARQYDAAQIRQAERDERADFVADRSYNAQQAQVKQAQENWQKNYEQQIRAFEMANTYAVPTQGGSLLHIPKANINATTVEDMFQVIPSDIREKVKGDPYSVKKGTGIEATEETAYKEATIDQKMAAIMAYLSDPTSDATKVASIRKKLSTLNDDEFGQYLR